MAEFDSEGTQKLIDSLSIFTEAALPRMTRKMVKTAGEAIAEEWCEGIRKNNYIDTGAMLASVKGKVKKENYSSATYYVDVYPQGTDAKGVRNATKAFVLHYGRHGKKGSYWVDDVEALAEPKANAAAQAILDEELSKLGL